MLILRLNSMKNCGSKLLDALLSSLPHMVQAVWFQVQRWSYQFSILVMNSCRHVIYFFGNLNGDIHLTEKKDKRNRKGITQTREICAEWVLIRLHDIACVFCDWVWHYLWKRVELRADHWSINFSVQRTILLLLLLILLLLRLTQWLLLLLGSSRSYDGFCNENVTFK